MEGIRVYIEIFPDLIRIFPIRPESITIVVWMKSKDAHPIVKKKKKFGPNASCRYAILCDILKSFSFFFQLKIHRRRENEKIFSEMIIPSSSLCVCSYNNDCSTKCIATAAFLNQCSYTMFTNWLYVGKMCLITVYIYARMCTCVYVCVNSPLHGKIDIPDKRNARNW